MQMPVDELSMLDEYATWSRKLTLTLTSRILSKFMTDTQTFPQVLTATKLNLSRS